MTVLARPSPLVEAGQPDHNACGPIAVTACLDALGLPTNWTDMRTAAGGDAQGTFASQLVTAAKSRDPSVVAFATVDDPTLVVDKWIPQGRYVLLAGQCYGSAEPAPLGTTTIEHWYIVFGTGWECCNIWGGTYPTYPNLAASYVSRLGCVVLGRTASKPPQEPFTMSGQFQGSTTILHDAYTDAAGHVHQIFRQVVGPDTGFTDVDLGAPPAAPVGVPHIAMDAGVTVQVMSVLCADGVTYRKYAAGSPLKWAPTWAADFKQKSQLPNRGPKGDPGAVPATAAITGTVSLH